MIENYERKKRKKKEAISLFFSQASIYLEKSRTKLPLGYVFEVKHYYTLKQGKVVPELLF